MPLTDCYQIDLPRVSDARGDLSYIENSTHIPFIIQRIFYMYDLPGKILRGGHAHVEGKQFIIPMAGSFDAMLDDGKQKKVFHLHTAAQGLYVCPMIWVQLENFSANAVCLVLASNRYDETEYIRNYARFIESARGVDASSIS